MITTPLIPVPLVVAAVQESNPESILDVGCAFGRYGFLFREALDASFDNKRSFSSKTWYRRIDAVEIHPGYISTLQKAIYDRIFIGDIMKVIKKEKIDNYDIIFMGDLIEHLTKEEGCQLLDWAYAKANKMVIITTPSYEIDTAQYTGYDVHKSLWQPADFYGFAGKRVVILSNRVLCAFLPKPGFSFYLPVFSRSPVLGAFKNFCGNLLKKSRLGKKIFLFLRRSKERLNYKK